MVLGEFREEIDRLVRGESRSVPVPYTDTWVEIGDRIEDKVEPGGTLRILRTPRLKGTRHVVLDGTARFRVTAFRAEAPEPRGTALLVEARAGEVAAGESEFTVTARGDTTDVQVHPTERYQRKRFVQWMVPAAVKVGRGARRACPTCGRTSRPGVGADRLGVVYHP